MEFEDAMRAAARIADGAVSDAMSAYAEGRVTDEDDLTPGLLGRLETALNGQIGGLKLKASVVRHRGGIAAEEKKIGADFLIHVHLETPTDRYSKGVLVQAKRREPDTNMSERDRSDLLKQCAKMLNISVSAFVCDYAKSGMRVASAARVAGAESRDLYSVCNWTSYRFFLELFRCPIGDPKITSALVDDLLVPQALVVKASGDFRKSRPRIRHPLV